MQMERSKCLHNSFLAYLLWNRPGQSYPLLYVQYLWRETATTNVFFFPVKRNNVTDHEALIKVCFIKRDHWPIEWADPYCPGFITLWIQIQDAVTVSQHTTWIPHARFPLNNRNMFTMALDHQVQVFLVSKPQPRTSGIVRNLHASGIRCFHMHVRERSAKPSLPHRPQTCLKET